MYYTFIFANKLTFTQIIVIKVILDSGVVIAFFIEYSRFDGG